ncbi:MAG: FeoA family protein [Halanaerobium sp.]|nr:FeoA family protein [Halanaerobium sp.]
MMVGKKKNRKTLVELENGEIGLVTKLRGGTYFNQRLQALGIRQGIKVTKLSSMLFNGPVTVKVGEAKVAIGRGMAEKIDVEVTGQ